MLLVQAIQSSVLHDTYIVAAATDEACALFRCDQEWIRDRLLTDLVIADLEGLVKFRLGALREFGYLHSQPLVFLRIDGSRFWANVTSLEIRDGYYISFLDYLKEYG